MSDAAPLHTVQLRDWLGRIQASDARARNELAQAISQRIEWLARKMLRGFQNVRRDADTLDVAQGALLRLLGSLEQQGRQFESTRHFMSFAASCIRTELLDLARRCGSLKRGAGQVVSAHFDSASGGAPEPAASLEPADELELWTRFHEAVAELPPDEAEVVGLKFYHGWTEQEIAELFEVSDRTIRRWWVSACVRLEKALGGAMPSASPESC